MTYELSSTPSSPEDLAERLRPQLEGYSAGPEELAIISLIQQRSQIRDNTQANTSRQPVSYLGAR